MKDDIYFSEKKLKKKQQITKLKIYGAFAVFFVLIAAVFYLIVYSSFFQIKDITVSVGSFDGEKIIGDLGDFSANQSKIASFLGSGNILIWEKGKISEFLKNYPQIAELKIEKNYIKRTIEIAVQEREKFGIWCQITQILADNTQINAENISENQRNNQRQSTSCKWFDKSGILFSEATSMEGNLINKIDDFSGRALKIGDKVLEEKFLSNLLEILEILEKSDLKIKSLKLEDIALQEIIADSPAAPKIYFSLRIAPVFVPAALESIKKIGLEKMEYIDLRVENRAYYKMK